MSLTRPLSTIERGIVLVDRAAPLNFTAYARVRGPLDEPAVRAALRAVRARHPFLQLHLEGEHFVEGAPEIPLRIATDLAEAATREIGTPFVDGSALLRAVWIPGDGVLLTFHHVVGDGRSGALLARDFVRAAAAFLRGEEPSLPALSPQPPLDERLPPLGARGVLRILYLLLLEMYLLVRHGPVLKVPRARELPPWERPAKVLVRWFEPVEVEALTARARSEGLTVHAVMSAALLLAVAEQAGGGPRRAAFGTPLDIRRSLRPRADDEIGFLVSMLGYRGMVDPRDDLFELARRVKEQLDEEKAWNGAVVGVRMLALASEVLGDSDPRVFARRFEQSVQTTTGITNLGRLAIESDHAPLTIESFAFTANPSVLGDFVVSAATLNGRMSLWFAYASPLIARAVAEAIAEGTVARVRSAARPRSER